MQSKLLHESGGVRTFALVLEQAKPVYAEAGLMRAGTRQRHRPHCPGLSPTTVY